MSNLNENWLEEYEGKEIENNLANVLTSKEVEKLYNLPPNIVLQDIKRGKVREGHYRQSSRAWLITRQECNRLYSNYKKRVKKQVSY